MNNFFIMDVKNDKTTEFATILRKTCLIQQISMDDEASIVVIHIKNHHVVTMRLKRSNRTPVTAHQRDTALAHMSGTRVEQRSAQEVTEDALVHVIAVLQEDEELAICECIIAVVRSYC